MMLVGVGNGERGEEGEDDRESISEGVHRLGGYIGGIVIELLRFLGGWILR